MKMIDMKLPKPKPEKNAKLSECVDGRDKYPWGLRLDLNNESIKKLTGVDSVDVGEEVTLSAVAKVVEKRANETQTGKDTRIELQIVKLGVERKVSADKAFEEGAA